MFGAVCPHLHNRQIVILLTVIILQDLIVDGRSHGDGLAGEVGVEIESLSQRHSCRWVTVSCKQAEHIVLASMSKGSKGDTMNRVI